MIYILTEDDEHEIPLIVGTAQEIADYAGTSRQNIYVAFSRGQKIRVGHKKYKVFRVKS